MWVISSTRSRVTMAALVSMISFLYVTNAGGVLLQEHRSLPSPRGVAEIFTTLAPFDALPRPLWQTQLPPTQPGLINAHHRVSADNPSSLLSRVNLRRLHAVEASQQDQDETGRYNDHRGYSKRPGHWGVPEDKGDGSSISYWRSIVDKAPSEHAGVSHEAAADDEQGTRAGSSHSALLERQRLQEEVQQIPKLRPPRIDTPSRYKSPAEASARLSRWLLWDPLVRLLSLSLAGSSECTTKRGLRGVCRLGATCSQGAGTGTPSADTCDGGYGTCCVNRVGCGDAIRANKTYFTTKVSSSGSCPVKVFKTSSEICHLRLDLATFRLKGPTLGSCQRDVFLVSGQNVNSFVPKLCGNNDGQHLYVDVDTVSGPLELNVITVGEGLERMVDVLVTQIPCTSAHRPPPNCLQYYTGTQGAFASFNYGQNGTGTYLNGMNYAICLRKEAGFCSIVYSADDLKMSTTYKFEVVNFIITTGTATSIVPAGEAGVGVDTCPNDFLVLGGTRLCGDRFNDGRDPTPTNNAPVTDMTNGPFIVQFQSNSESVGCGFRLSYRQNPC